LTRTKKNSEKTGCNQEPDGVQGANCSIHEPDQTPRRTCPKTIIRSIETDQQVRPRRSADSNIKSIQMHHKKGVCRKIVLEDEENRKGTTGRKHEIPAEESIAVI
jgi:hypothetical protein